MDSSLEKAQRARAGVQIAVWNESSTWLGPLREYARISNAIRAGVCPEPLKTDSEADSKLSGRAETRGDSGADEAAASSIDRRIRFLGWEIATLIETRRACANSSSELLNTIFFQELGFTICEESTFRRLDGAGALFETVLARRTGPPTLIAMLYAWVGEIVGRAYGESSDFVRIEIIHSAPTEVVRVIPHEDRGTIWLVNLLGGQRVDEEVWSDWIVSSSPHGFAKLTWVQGLVRSLTELFKLLEKSSNLSLDLLSAELFILDQIISLQPSETSRWAERAMLNTRRGDRASALDDLKRFFAFHERASAPAAIVSLFNELRGHDLN